MAENSFRTSIRADVISTLMETFPDAVRVDEGIAWRTNILDPATGKPYCVVVGVRVPLTEATPTRLAYDIDAAVEQHASRPGRKIIDPAKAAERAAHAEKVATARADNLEVLRQYVAAGHLASPKWATTIRDEIPRFADMAPMNLGALLKYLVEDGTVTVELDENRKKLYRASL